MINKFVNMAGATIIATALSVAFASPAFAASKPSTSRPPSEPVGYDVSWPQCTTKLPLNPAFVVVGINGGRADNVNPCLEKQLKWAKTAPGTALQPSLQLYLNTANPGTASPNWPKSNTDPNGQTVENRYIDELCTVDNLNSKSCAWQYGYNRAFVSHNEFFKEAVESGVVSISTDASSYVWWLDVEADNSWQSGSDDSQALNRAVLEGMTDYLIRSGAITVGIYSNNLWWNDITGGKDKISPDSSLNAMPDWRPSGTLKIAKYNCTVASPLTNGGYVSLTQYVVAGLDRNYSCPR